MAVQKRIPTGGNRDTDGWENILKQQEVGRAVSKKLKHTADQDEIDREENFLDNLRDFSPDDDRD